ncbi:unnamed protein product [Cylicocyclus nassatus]|uniref:Uncharacterized protein n=1 Tax=Cylicocyclus nassatus TaxID=53992 RepID=A0AA36GVS5_CYLNA|nr:unnamed protein product [Cylicocyclus nassatus]
MLLKEFNDSTLMREKYGDDTCALVWLLDLALSTCSVTLSHTCAQNCLDVVGLPIQLNKKRQTPKMHPIVSLGTTRCLVPRNCSASESRSIHDDRADRVRSCQKGR